MIANARSRLQRALVVGALAACVLGASPAAASSSDINRAVKLLRGHVYTHFAETGVLGGTIDQRLKLCSDKKFIYDTESYLPETGTTVNTHTTGRWRVTSAHFARHGQKASAQIRGTPDDGSPPVTVKFARAADGTVTIDGRLVDVARSNCR